jgi:protein tyrosine phosphatase (PTP) superfamily phosphohydrolase (DUF442 family)
MPSAVDRPLLPLVCCLAGLILVAAACWEPENVQERPRNVVAAEPVESVHLPNLHRLTPGLYSGGSPHGEAGLAELAALGVRTVISVDGETPAVDAAAKRGLRYVHLPIGYDGLPRERIVQLAATIRSLPGPVYIHCHRGLHRGPAAAVAVCRVLADLDAAAAEQLLERLGTARKYPGLYASVDTVQPVTEQDLRRYPASRLPSTTTVSPLVEEMVAIETLWDGLSKRLETATGWDAALQADFVVFDERLQEAVRLHPLGAAEFAGYAARLLQQTEFTTRRDPRATRSVVQEACQDCHRRYRDQPRGFP